MIEKRVLASIQTIAKLDSIPGKDFIAYAHISGWKCIVKKTEFKEGDLCVFFEIDSFLPIEERYSFLENTRTNIYNNKFNVINEEDKIEGYRLRTLKMNGIVSQGLALPISYFDELNSLILKENLDLTDLLNVLKWDRPIKSIDMVDSESLGDFPWFIKDTNQKRIQNLTEYFDLYQDIEFEQSLKLDGVSSGFCYLSDELKNRYGMKQNELLLSKTNMWNIHGKNQFALVNKKLKLIDMLKELNLNIVLQGEIMGSKLIHNREKLSEPDFYLYSIYDIVSQKPYLAKERDDLIQLIKEKFNYNLKLCPILKVSKIFKEYNNLDDLLINIEGPSLNHHIREGVVFKSTELFNGEQITFKAISNQFLIKGGN